MIQIHAIGTKPLYTVKLRSQRTAPYFEEEHPDWFSFYYFPTYSPELNPVEQCWHHVKGVAPANYTAKDKDDLMRKVMQSTTRINDDKNCSLLSFNTPDSKFNSHFFPERQYILSQVQILSNYQKFFWEIIGRVPIKFPLTSIKNDAEDVHVVGPPPPSLRSRRGFEIPTR